MKTKTTPTAGTLNLEAGSRFATTISIATAALIALLFIALTKEIETSIRSDVLVETVKLEFVGLS